MLRLERETRAIAERNATLSDNGAVEGYDKQAMHDALAFRFLRIEDDPITGSPRRQHTPETDTKEFAEYVDHCIQFAAELGVEIPAPYTVVAA